MKPRAGAHVVERTCIGCRRRAPASELARLSLSAGDARGEVVVWTGRGQRPPGRGASLHVDPTCVRSALKTGAFGRAFRTGVGSINEADFFGQLSSAQLLRSVNRKNP